MSLIQSIILKFVVIQSNLSFKSNFHVIWRLYIRIYIVIWLYIDCIDMHDITCVYIV